MATVVLIEASPANAASAAIVPVRLAGGGTAGYTHKGFNDWMAGVAQLPLFQAGIDFDETGFTGSSQPQTLQVRFVAYSSARLSTLANLFWTGAAITVSTGDDSTLPLVPTVQLAGTVTDAAIDESSITLTVSDLSAALAITTLPDSFLGTGGLEGGTDAIGRPKRRTWGHAFNIEGMLLDSANNIYEFGDPYRQLHAFTAVKDKGVVADTTVAPVQVAWAGSAAATLTALQGAAAPQGGCAEAPSIACVKWWTVPSGPLTADIQGDIAGTYSEALGDIAQDIVQSYAPTITVSDVAAINSARPGACGIHCGDASETVANLLDRLLLPMSTLWVLDPNGAIRMRNWTFASPVETLRSVNPIKRDAVFPPLLERQVGYQRNYRIQTDSEIASVLDDNIQDDLAQALSDSSAALTQIGIIGSDSILSRGEKPAAIKDVAAILGEKTSLDTQGAAQGLTAQVAALDAAYSALMAYLAGLSPLYSDTTVDTPIVAATFTQNFTTYYNAKIALITAMANQAAQAVAMGNRIKMSLMEKGTAGWALLANNGPATINATGVGALNGVPYFQVTATFTAANQGLVIGQAAGYEFSVSPGERIAVFSGVQAAGPIASGNLYCDFFDKNGADVPVNAHEVAQGFTGQETAFTVIGGWIIVPPSAVKGRLSLNMFSSGASSAGAAYIGISHPIVVSAPIGQNTPPVFVAGPNAVDGADVTGVNTALDTTKVAGTPSQQVLDSITLASSVATQASTDAQFGKTFAADVADNNTFSKDEKKRYIVEITNLMTDVPNQVAKAITFGLSAQATALTTAFNALVAYLNHNDYSDLSKSDHIDRGTFNATVGAYTAAETALAAALQQYSANLSISASQANIFLDPRFLAPTDTTSWASFGAGAVPQDAGDGRRVQFPVSSAEVDLATELFVLGPQDRVDIQFEYYVETAVSSNTLFGIAAQGFDNNGIKLWGSLVATTTVSVVPARGVWLTFAGTVLVSAQGGTPANTAVGNLYIFAQAITGGGIYIRNPRAYRVVGANANLGVNGRQTSALLTTAFAINASILANGLSITGTNAALTITNFTVDFGDGYTPITGTTITGLSASTVYYLYLLAPNMSDTGRSFSLSTSFTSNADKNRVYLGSFTTAATAGGTASPGGGGAGSGPIDRR